MKDTRDIPRGRTVALPLVFASGLASLGYQMTWIRLFSAGLGHEVPAVVAVLVAFLGGMALGAGLIDRRLARSIDPLRWFVALEFLIGAWGLASAWGIPAINRLALELLGPQPSPLRHWMVVFVLPGTTLLPATAAMGATLPVMLRCWQTHWPGGQCVGALYGANTLGAALGTLGTTFLLMPIAGLRGTVIALAAINVGVALAARALRSSAAPTTWNAETARRSSRRRQTQPERGASYRKPVVGRSTQDTTTKDLHPSPSRESPSGPWLATALIGGCLGLAFELVGVRGLAQVLENTVYTYAAVLSVYLGGTALGGFLFQRTLRECSPRHLIHWLLAGLSVSGVLAAWALRAAATIHTALRDRLGDHPFDLLLADITVAAMVFAIPTILMGALFSLVTEASAREGRGAGRAVMWNTLGAAAAVVIVTLWLLPGTGVGGSLVAIAVVYGVWILAWLRRDAWRKEWWRPVIPLAIAALIPHHLSLLRVPEGASVVAVREGVLATAAVIKSADGNRTLRVNNRLQMGGTSSLIAQQREAHLPILLHPAPRSALFIGPGTGITLGAAIAHPGLQLTAVELLPEVVELMPQFEPENGGPFSPPRVKLYVADARRFLRTDPNRYDVIVADLFHPAQDGAGFLYTREHFDAVRQRLTDDGLFCQWLPLHQLDPKTLRIIVRTFIEVFSQARGMLLHFNVDIPVLGLIGTRGPWELDPVRIDQRLMLPEVRAAGRGVGLDKAVQLLGSLAGGPRALRAYADTAVVATDVNPAVLFAAPNHSARRNAPAHETLLDWIDSGASRDTEWLEGNAWRQQPEYARTVREFIEGRDLYLRGLIREGAGDLAGAVELYLESSQRSLYFTPAYARVVTIIQIMVRADRPQARRWWERLEAVRPDQPLGRQLLAPLFAPESSGPSPELKP